MNFYFDIYISIFMSLLKTGCQKRQELTPDKKSAIGGRAWPVLFDPSVWFTRRCSSEQKV
jgi:hypothetical protein